MVTKRLTIVALLLFTLVSGYLLETVVHTKLKYKVLEKRLEKSKETIDDLNQDLTNSEKTIDHLEDSVMRYEETLKSRKYYEELIIDQSKIRAKKSLRALDDDVFFLMLSQSQKYDIPIEIYFRLVDMESGFKFVENKKSGAYGYMQVMPSTFNYLAKKLGIEGPHNELNNILIGSWLLKKNYSDWLKRGFSSNKSWRFALAEYNAGEGKLQIKRNGRVVGWKEPSYTTAYINYIMKEHNKRS